MPRATRGWFADAAPARKSGWVRPGSLPNPSSSSSSRHAAGFNDSVFITGHSTAGVQFRIAIALLRPGRAFSLCDLRVQRNSTATILTGILGNGRQDVPQLAYVHGCVFVSQTWGRWRRSNAFEWKNRLAESLSAPDQQRDGPASSDFAADGDACLRKPDNDRPWSASPVIVFDGKVFVLPSDGNTCLGYDAGTGAEVKRIKLAHLSNAETLLGVIDDRMVLVSGGADGTDTPAHLHQLAAATRWPTSPPTPGQTVLWKYPIRSAACAGAGSSPRRRRLYPDSEKLFRST